MILGPGTARTEPAIFEEYRQFLKCHGGVSNAKALHLALQTPECMRTRIGKRLGEWTDEDLLALYRNRSESTQYRYSLFIAFLLFHGYRRASFHLLTQLPSGFNLAKYYTTALAEVRGKLEKIRETLGYYSHGVGGELGLLLALLAWAHKSLEALTRADFDAFAAQYQVWYRSLNRRKDGKPDPDLKRLEFYLIHWGKLPKAKVTYRHEEYFAFVNSVAVRSALLTFMAWCEAKYQPATLKGYRAALHLFFEWFQARSPAFERLEEVTRADALAYVRALREDYQFSTPYGAGLYHKVRVFFEFAIVEQLATSPDRNPFASRDLPKVADPVARYLSDAEVRKILAYCQTGASLKEKTLVTLLFHTGIRAGELARLKVSDIVQVQGKWKLHIHEGKGLKDRLIPLTADALAALQIWQAQGWERIHDWLFTRYGRVWSRNYVSEIVHTMGLKLDLPKLSAQRFRHTFAVALLNYGMRESALQKLLGHATLEMTMHYARILDQTVEQAFTSAVKQMEVGPLSWVPNFLSTGDYSLFVEGDAVSWIRLPHGYCRRNPKLHCESDVKCLLCDRYVAAPEDLPKLRAMQERFQALGLQVKADVVAAQVQRLEAQTSRGFVPLTQIVA